MLQISKDYDLISNKATILKMISFYRTNIAPIMRKRKEYYLGNQKILDKTYADNTLETNNIVTNYCKNITEIYTGYLTTPGNVKYNNIDEQIKYILDYNDYKTEDSELLRDTLIYGTGIELFYIDKDKKIRFDNIPAENSFGVYSADIEKELLYFIRYYKIIDWENDYSEKYIVEIYDKMNKYSYETHGFGDLENEVIERHYFNTVPVVINYLNEDEENIYDCIITLQDAYNEALSDNIDNYSYFADAYLVLAGATIPGESDEEKKEYAQEMRKNRIFEIPYDNAKMEFLTKPDIGASIQESLKTIKENIYKIAQCPDFSDNEVFGNSSGVALKYKLCNIEDRAATIEAQLKKSLIRRMEIIDGFATMLTGYNDWLDVDIEFIRNIPTDVSEVATLVNTLRGVISNETLLSLIPYIDDVEEELDKIESQADIYGDFSKEVGQYSADNDNAEE